MSVSQSDFCQSDMQSCVSQSVNCQSVDLSVVNQYSSGVCSKMPRYQVGTVSAYTPILQPGAVSFNTPHGIPYPGGISFFLSFFLSCFLFLFLSFFFCFSETEIAKDYGMKSELL